jgi:hypothetical protein
MKRIVLAVPLICLAACDSGPDVDAKNAKPSEVAEQMRDAVAGETFVRPGKWLSTVTIEEMSMPGMPPELSARMKETMAKQRQVESCLTPEEAKRPKGDFFAADKSCTYDHFTLGGGKIDAAMRCSNGGVAQSMTMQGSYTPDQYQMAMATKLEGKGPQAGMVMRMRVNAKRVGDCDGSERTAAAN